MVFCRMRKVAVALMSSRVILASAAFVIPFLWSKVLVLQLGSVVYGKIAVLQPGVVRIVTQHGGPAEACRVAAKIAWHSAGNIQWHAGFTVSGLLYKRGA